MARDGRDFEVSWRPFQLRPNHPPEGVEKAPDTPENPRVGARLKAAGQSVGIDFTGKTDRSPNTLLAHTLMDWCAEVHGSSKQNELQEVLFRAYFTDGVFPNAENLANAAKEIGLDATEALAAVNDTQRQAQAQRAAQSASQNGISGVPFFFIEDKPAFSGAQDPDTFLKAFRQLAP